MLVRIRHLSLCHARTASRMNGALDGIWNPFRGRLAVNMSWFVEKAIGLIASRQAATASLRNGPFPGPTH